MSSFSLMEQQPLVDQVLPTIEAAHSHSHTHTLGRTLLD